jgi:hypothetical protein
MVDFDLRMQCKAVSRQTGFHTQRREKGIEIGKLFPDLRQIGCLITVMPKYYAVLHGNDFAFEIFNVTVLQRLGGGEY